MCAPDDGAPPLPDAFAVRFFDPGTKCCTFHPSLPNYLVGAILASTEPDMEEGRRRVREKIARGIGVTPRGVLMPRKYAVLYDNGVGLFGRSRAMACPYYAEGQCSIWRFREAVCTTYFCKYVRGDKGKAFWEALKSYLSVSERELSLHAAAAVERDRARLVTWWESWDAKPSLAAHDVDELPPPESERRASWGEWVGREEEFYLKCHEAVSRLTPETFLRALGADEPFLRAKLEAARDRAAKRELPRRLRRNPELCVVRRGDHYVCASQASPGNAFELSALFYPLLDQFDGSVDNAIVRRKLEVEHALVVPDELLQTLHHAGILLEA